MYIDDMAVASRDQVQHQEDLRRVLQHLEEHSLVLNKEKCTFPPQSSKGELQRFLGIVNYYRCFISRAASTLKPLTDTTCGPGGHNTPVEWTQQLDSAFKQAKEALSNMAALAHPLPNADLSLALDASDHHVGGVLQEHSGDIWQPLTFFSRKLKSAESSYSTFDRELLACVSTIQHFRFLPEGWCFFILSDHKLLSYALHRVSDP